MIHSTLMRVTTMLLVLLCCAVGFAQQTSIRNSKHNLSAGGPGAIRAASEQEICIFCHAPHNSSPIQPLWNRLLPVSAYTVYSSTSLQAKPGQPTGSSKLCLSCHDGTIAVGSVLSREQPIVMAGGITTLPPGHGNLGTDLSDDHPISFRYDAALSTQDTKIKAPNTLPTAIKLDKNEELQCTSCHDPHNDQFGKFLVMENSTSQLCNACHQISTTTIASHQLCAACHQMHTAPSGALLLTAANTSESCLKCHSSAPGPNQGVNIASDMQKISRHYTPPGAPAAGTDLAAADCASCHESHSMQTGTATAPLVQPKLGKIDGVSVSGGKITAAKYEYEVCFKCHDTGSVQMPHIARQVVQTSARLQFISTAVSYHPVVQAGKNADMPSLRTGLTTASLIYCSDCHNSDTSKLTGSTGPNGPHGSNTTPLLAARYDTTDNNPESALTYALCYKCHDRTSILNNESFALHKLHVSDQHTPCSVCHDAHGISSNQGTTTTNAHLINFDLQIVQPETASRRIEYRTLGARAGQCTLSCHGTNHNAAAYPGGTLNGVGAPAPLAPQMAPLRRPPARR